MATFHRNKSSEEIALIPIEQLNFPHCDILVNLRTSTLLTKILSRTCLFIVYAKRHVVMFALHCFIHIFLIVSDALTFLSLRLNEKYNVDGCMHVGDLIISSRSVINSLSTY